TLRAADARPSRNVEGSGHRPVGRESLDLADVEVVGVRHPERVARAGGDAQRVAAERGDLELCDRAGAGGPDTGGARYGARVPSPTAPPPETSVYATKDPSPGDRRLGILVAACQRPRSVARPGTR